jgi:hypothetical protein
MELLVVGIWRTAFWAKGDVSGFQSLLKKLPIIDVIASQDNYGMVNSQNRMRALG